MAGPKTRHAGPSHVFFILSSLRKCVGGNVELPTSVDRRLSSRNRMRVRHLKNWIKLGFRFDNWTKWQFTLNYLRGGY